MSGSLTIGGAPIVTLRSRELPHEGPAFTEAEVLPGRGMMLLQARLRLPSGEMIDAIHAPPADEAARRLNGGPDDAFGNQSFAFGGALLAPYANRIRGPLTRGGREIETVVDGRPARLPANWSGKAPSAERYAMHGLILDAKAAFDQPAPDRVTARLDAGNFGGRWPGELRFEFEWRLAGRGMSLRVEAENVGHDPAPVGIGWHPYFNLPSGERGQARLKLPARRRVEVGDYDAVLPTGRLIPVEGVYDVNGPTGGALGEAYFDDCFTDLTRSEGTWTAEIHDPAAGVGLRIATLSKAVKAAQVFAPPEQAFVVLEPQFNLADPYGAEWPAGQDTGMVRLAPGARTAYEVTVEPFAV